MTALNLLINTQIQKQNKYFINFLEKIKIKKLINFKFIINLFIQILSIIETTPFENEHIKKSLINAISVIFNLLPSLSSNVFKSAYSKLRKLINLISPF